MSRVLLVGRPNSGKSTLFNRLTGASARVGNFPGVTVDLLEGRAEPWAVIDLPGLYSVKRALDPATDEGIAATVLAKEPADSVIVQVLDGTQLALGLKLTQELLSLERKLLVVVTQLDLLQDAGKSLDVKRLEQALGVPVLAISARDPRSRDAVLERLAVANDAALTPSTPRSFDPAALARSALGDGARVRARTRTIDRWLLHPWLGPLLFLTLMTAAFTAVFLVADPVTTWIDDAMGWLGDQAERVLGAGVLGGFVKDGVLGGAGTVLIFMPQIVILTVVLELLEASGYLARGAFLLDRLLRAVGLSGRAFVPMLMGHACAIPAIGATRILRDPRERLTTILVLPLMTCSARLPTYGLLLTAFFSHRSAWFRAGLFVFLYFAGIAAACLAAWVLERRVVKGKSLPLVLEMPLYRAPEWKLVATKGWRAAKRFLRDVGTTIVIAASVLYLLLNVPVRAAADGDEPLIDRSVAASVGKALEPVSAQAGFDWRINIGLIASFGARELMVGTMGVIMGIEDAEEDSAPLAAKLREAKKDDGTPLYSTATAAALMAFFVIACQCMSTVAAIRRETKSWRWPAFVLAYTYTFAYLAAVTTFHLVRAFS